MNTIRVKSINKRFLHLGGFTVESGCLNPRYSRIDNKRFVIFIADETLPTDTLLTIDDGIKQHTGKVMGRALDNTQIMDTVPERPMVGR